MFLTWRDALVVIVALIVGWMMTALATPAAESFPVGVAIGITWAAGAATVADTAIGGR